MKNEESKEDIEALNEFLAEYNKIDFYRPEYRYSIVFKQYNRSKKQTFRSDLNFTNFSQKYGNIIINERIAILFLFAERNKYYQWFSVYDNNLKEGPEKKVFQFNNPGVSYNTLFNTDEIKAVKNAIQHYYQGHSKLHDKIKALNEEEKQKNNKKQEIEARPGSYADKINSKINDLVNIKRI